MSLSGFVSVVLICAVRLSAGQIVKLHNGQTMRVEKADRDGDQIFLTVGSAVTIFGVAEIRSIEVEPDPNQPVVGVVKADRQDTKAMIRAAAKTHGLPTHLVESIAAVESGMKTNAVSPKGAIGVMQLMPGTARQLGVDPHDVAQNIDGGTRLMRELLIKYQDDPDQVRKALAAYNAGPGAVARYRGIPPYKETRDYVRKILNKMSAAEAAGLEEQ